MENKVNLNAGALYLPQASLEFHEAAREVYKVENAIFQSLIDTILAEEFVTHCYTHNVKLYVAKKVIGNLSFNIELRSDYRFSIEVYPVNTNYSAPFLRDQLLYKGYADTPERINEILHYYRLNKLNPGEEAEYEYLEHEKKMWKKHTGSTFNYRQIEQLNTIIKDYGIEKDPSKGIILMG